MREQGMGSGTICKVVPSVQQYEYAFSEDDAELKERQEMQRQFREDIKRANRETEPPKISGTRAMDIDWGDTPVSEETARIQREVEGRSGKIRAVVYG